MNCRRMYGTRLANCQKIGITLLAQSHKWDRLWLMKFRPDLVVKLTPEMLRASVEANNPRYKSEPLFSKTGTGSLSTASTEQRASEDALSTEVIQKLMRESDSNGKGDGSSR